MSFAETQQIMADLKEIMALIDGVTIKTEKIQNNLPKTTEAITSLKQLERLSLRYLAIVNRMGLPEDVQQQVKILAELLIIVRMLQISVNALTSGTWIGVLTGIAGTILTGFAVYDSMEGY